MCNHEWLELDAGKGIEQDWVRCLQCNQWIASYHFDDSLHRKMKEVEE